MQSSEQWRKWGAHFIQRALCFITTLCFFLAWETRGLVTWVPSLAFVQQMYELLGKFNTSCTSFVFRYEPVRFCCINRWLIQISPACVFFLLRTDPPSLKYLFCLDPKELTSASSQEGEKRDAAVNCWIYHTFILFGDRISALRECPGSRECEISGAKEKHKRCSAT